MNWKLAEDMENWYCSRSFFFRVHLFPSTRIYFSVWFNGLSKPLRFFISRYFVFVSGFPKKILRYYIKNLVLLELKILLGTRYFSFSVVGYWTEEQFIVFGVARLFFKDIFIQKEQTLIAELRYIVYKISYIIFWLSRHVVGPPSLLSNG
jgi:hypothetical protein